VGGQDENYGHGVGLDYGPNSNVSWKIFVKYRPDIIQPGCSLFMSIDHYHVIGLAVKWSESIQKDDEFSNINNRDI
jgi:hypothetical protein